MKNHLLEQFNTTYNTKDWCATLLDAVRGLTDAQAREKVKTDINSTYELVTHLVTWNERYLRNLREQQVPVIDNNIDTFKNEANLHWDELLAKAEHIFSEWQKELDKGLPTDSNTDWVSIVGHINTHNAYHIGQIVIIRKLQGNWDSRNGVS